MNNSQTKPSLLWKPNPHRLQLTITTKLTSSPSARLVHPLAAALSTPSRLLAELTADLSSRCLAPPARTSRLEPTTTARFAGWRRGAGRVAEEGALPEPHPAGCLSAGPAALGRSLQSAPGWMWSQASESRSPRLPSISCKGSSTHLLAAFLLTWVARRPLPKQRRVVRRRARAPAGRNLVTRRRRRTRTRPQLRGTLVPTCNGRSRAAYPPPTHLQQQLGLVQSGLSSLTINSK